MEASGKNLLKITSILLIIFGAIDAFVSLIGLACTSFLTNFTRGLTGSTFAGAAVGWVLTAAALLLLAAGVLDMVIGIMGMKKYADPAQAKFFIVWGIVLCAVPFISMVLSFQFTSLLAFALPALYIVGGYMTKKSTLKGNT